MTRVSELMRQNLRLRIGERLYGTVVTRRVRIRFVHAIVLVVSSGLVACGYEPGPNVERLRNPADSAFQAQAPDHFRVRFETSRGDFVMEVRREWAPNGADRLYNLVRAGYYDDVRFFRVVEGFMAQFGINGDPRTAVAWAQQTIGDDPPVLSNTRGTVTFAMRGPHSRTTQLFVNFVDSPALDEQGFVPVGQIVEGMDVVDQIYAGYGEMAPRGGGPAPQFILQRGNDWLRAEYPRLDYIQRATIETDG